MRTAAVWFWMSCKRYLKKPSFLLVLLFLPVLCFLICRGESRGSRQIRVALCVEDSGSGGNASEAEDLGGELVRILTEESASEDALFYFYLCPDEESVIRETASRRAECGYVIEAGLRERLMEGEASRSIFVYRSPATVLDRLSDEVVFSALARLYDREIFVDYIENGDTVSDGLKGQAGKYYDAWAENGSTFSFSYRYYDRVAGESGAAAEDTLFPVRGLAAVCLFLIGVYSSMLLAADEKNGLFLCLLPGERLACKAVSALAPVLLASVSCMAALWVGGCVRSWGRELAVMAVYVPSVCAYGWILKKILPTSGAIGALIPFLLAASLIFCPVFVDLERWIPRLALFGRLLPPWYYLRAF